MSVTAAAGFEAGGFACGIKPDAKLDLALLAAVEGTIGSAVPLKSATGTGGPSRQSSSRKAGSGIVKGAMARIVPGSLQARNQEACPPRDMPLAKTRSGSIG